MEKNIEQLFEILQKLGKITIVNSKKNTDKYSKMYRIDLNQSITTIDIEFLTKIKNIVGLNPEVVIFNEKLNTEGYLFFGIINTTEKIEIIKCKTLEEAEKIVFKKRCKKINPRLITQIIFKIKNKKIRFNIPQISKIEQKYKKLLGKNKIG